MPARTPRSGLAGKKISPDSEAAEIFIENQLSSPLLRLPPELRQIIYEYVLGGNKTIYIDFQSHEWKRHQVNGQSKWTHVVKGGFHCSVWPPGANPFNCGWMYHKSKKRGSKPLSHGFTLLSQVCRQLYHETAILPMVANTWAFANSHVMTRYLIKERRLSLAQRRAMRVIFVYSETVLSRILVKHLGNLQMIYVHGEVVREVDPRSIEVGKMGSQGDPSVVR